MFNPSGATRQSAAPLPQTSRARRQNIRTASPGPSNVAGGGGGGLFSSATGGSVKASYTQRDHFPSIADLPQDQKDEINDAFSLFDLNQDRKIDYHELKVAMKALGFDTPKSELLSLLHQHGVEASGHPPPSTGTLVSPANLYITHASFVEIMSHKILERDPLEEIGRAFELFAGVAGGGDRRGDAKIGIEDLRRVAKELGENLEEEEMRAMIEEFDIDNDGMISRDEFISICKGD